MRYPAGSEFRTELLSPSINIHLGKTITKYAALITELLECKFRLQFLM